MHTVAGRRGRRPLPEMCVSFSSCKNPRPAALTGAGGTPHPSAPPTPSPTGEGFVSFCTNIAPRRLDRRRRMQNPRKRRSRHIWDVFRFRVAKSSVFSRRRKTPREPPGSQVYSRASFSWIEWRKTTPIWRKAPVTGAFPLIFEAMQAAKPYFNSLSPFGLRRLRRSNLTGFRSG